MSKSRSPHFEIAHTDLCLTLKKKEKFKPNWFWVEFGFQ